MDEALVQDAEDQVDHDQGGGDQQRHRAERLLERLGVALEAGLDRGGSAQVDHGLLHGRGGAAERDTLAKVEAHRDGRKLALVADRQRPHRRVDQCATAESGTMSPVAGALR